MHELIKRIRFSWVVVLVAAATLVMQLVMDSWQSGKLPAATEENYAFLPAKFCGVREDVCAPGCETVCTACPRQPGVTLSIVPFFFIAHVVANLGGYPADGYSPPYLIAVLLSSLVYLIIGLFFLHRILRLSFPDYIANLAIICIALGSNIFYFFNIVPGSGHIVAFMLVAIFIYNTIQWHQYRDTRSSLLLGFTAGLLALVREADLCVLAFFLLYEVKSGRSFMYKLRIYGQHYARLALIAIITVAFWFVAPVFCAWCSGAPLFEGCYHAGVTGDVHRVLEFRPALAVYAPVMLFSIAGFFSLIGYMRKFLLPSLVTVLLYLAVVAMLWTSQKGQFGYRTVIDLYPVLAFPFSALLSKMLNLGSYTRRAVYILLILFIVLSLRQTMLLAKDGAHDGYEEPAMHGGSRGSAH